MMDFSPLIMWDRWRKANSSSGDWFCSFTDVGESCSAFDENSCSGVWYRSGSGTVCVTNMVHPRGYDERIRGTVTEVIYYDEVQDLGFEYLSLLNNPYRPFNHTGDDS